MQHPQVTDDQARETHKPSHRELNHTDIVAIIFFRQARCARFFRCTRTSLFTTVLTLWIRARNSSASLRPLAPRQTRCMSRTFFCRLRKRLRFVRERHHRCSCMTLALRRSGTLSHTSSSNCVLMHEDGFKLQGSWGRRLGKVRHVC